MATIVKVEIYKGTWELRVVVSALTEAGLIAAQKFCKTSAIENGVEFTCYTRKDFANFQREIGNIEHVHMVRGSIAKRYGTSLADAVNRGLAHGKSWACSQHDVDTGKMPSGFEGEQVCYVYPS